MIVLVAAHFVLIGVRSKTLRQKLDPREAGRALWNAKWDRGLPLLVIVSIASGFATIVESAALGAPYAIILELAVHLNWRPPRDIPPAPLHPSPRRSPLSILLSIPL